MFSAISLAARSSASRKARCAGEALQIAGNVIGHAGEGRARHDRLVGGKVDQIVLRVDAVVLARRQRGGRIENQRGARGVEPQHQPMGRRHAGGVAVELERQRVADLHLDPRFAGGIGLVHRRDFHAHQLFAQAGLAVITFGIHRLETAGRERRQSGDGDEPNGDPGPSQRHSRSSWELRLPCGRPCRRERVLPHRAPKRQPQFPDFGRPVAR